MLVLLPMALEGLTKVVYHLNVSTPVQIYLRCVTLNDFVSCSPLIRRYAVEWVLPLCFGGRRGG